METQLKPHTNDSDKIQGNLNATITLVEYGDYQCPHCGHAYPIVKNLQQIFGDKLRFVFRNFPLQNIHPLAVTSAIGTLAAAKQNKYWEMHDVIFENQENLLVNSFSQFAQELGMNIEQFENDLLDDELSYKVTSDFESGIESGVNGTPTFFINNKRYNGNPIENDLIEAINKILNQ
jgi:protein-disulfide isomerase